MTSAERFRKFIEDARKQTEDLDAVAAHGFLTAAAICPDGYEHRAWQSDLFGEEPVDETLVRSARECIAAIRSDFLVGDYAPEVGDEADCIRWSEGFHRVVALAEEDWTAFTEDYLRVGKALFILALFSDPKLYSDLFAQGPTHQEFMRENAELLGPLVRKMAAYLLADEEMRNKLLEDEPLDTWPEADLHSLSDDKLIDRLPDDGGRVPRVAVDERTRRDAAFEADAFVETYVRPSPKVGRNDPCPCGSGRKYKKCCINKP